MRTGAFLCVAFLFSAFCGDITGQPTTARPALCGMRSMATEDPLGIPGSRAAGMTEALPGSWPWLASLQQPLDYEGRDFGHTCDALIVNQWWTLTAAHCFKGIGSDYLQWRLVAGAHRLSILAPRVWRIARKIEHQGYDPETERNDVALLLTKHPVPFGDFIQPACLPRRDTPLPRLSECYTAGWGGASQSLGEAEDVLREAPVRIVALKKCNSSSWYDGTLGNDNLCARYERGGTDGCQGDGGGLLMCRRPQTKIFIVVGIASWGWGCGPAQSPGVFTSLQFFLDWIIENMDT